MDKEDLEKEIEKLLKEQAEIRILVAENRDEYLLHLGVHLNLLSNKYINLIDLYLNIDKLNEFERHKVENLKLSLKKLNKAELDKIENIQLKIKKLNEEARIIIVAELEKSISNARPPDTPL